MASYQDLTRTRQRQDSMDRPSFRRSDCRGYTHDGRDDHNRHGNRRPPSHRHSSDGFRRRLGMFDWKCAECAAWNQEEAHRCSGCGVLVREVSPSPREDVRGSSEYRSGSEHSRSEEFDEFGRKRFDKPTPKILEWPPCFQSDGSAYVFDSRSGMFYESESDFFYDPKSKLYYGNKKGAYYRYNEGRSPPFDLVKEAPKVETASDGESPDTLDMIPSALKDNKAKIAIKLKSKELKRKDSNSEKSKTKVKSSQASRVRKLHDANIQKWSVRGKEIREDSSSETGSSDEVATTAKGEPICLLCKRKFATVEKLRNHEKASALHKENLLKRGAKRKQGDSIVYQDRAKQRRLMYGPESKMSSVRSAEDLEPPSDSVSDLRMNNLGNSNIGNQMLKKLGWQAGETLGRQSHESESLQKSLQKDWEKIESIAGAQQTPGQKTTW